MATSQVHEGDGIGAERHRDRLQQLQERLDAMRSAHTPAGRNNVSDLLSQVRAWPMLLAVNYHSCTSIPRMSQAGEGRG